MNNNSKKLQEWLINKIRTEYAEDIDLLLAVKGHVVNDDDHGEVFDFFIPATPKAYELSETFIIDGIGHDLYPRSWERMERNADLEEGQVFCLGNSEIIYARNDEVQKRYQQLFDRMENNLNNIGFTYKKALEQLDIAMDVYTTLMFEETLCQVRFGASLIIHYLNDAVCYLNRTYMEQMNAQEKLKSLDKLPENFLTYEEAIIRAESMDELKNLTYLLIRTTRKFISSFKNTKKDDTAAPDYLNLADWYQELSLCWRRIYYFCTVNDYQNAFTDARYLQSELNVVGVEFGLPDMDLMGAYDYTNLSKLKARAKKLEEYILDIFAKNNVQLNQYANIEDFLEAH